MSRFYVQNLKKKSIFCQNFGIWGLNVSVLCSKFQKSKSIIFVKIFWYLSSKFFIFWSKLHKSQFFCQNFGLWGLNVSVLCSKFQKSKSIIFVKIFWYLSSKFFIFWSKLQKKSQFIVQILVIRLSGVYCIDQVLKRYSRSKWYDMVLIWFVILWLEYLWEKLVYSFLSKWLIWDWSSNGIAEHAPICA